MTLLAWLFIVGWLSFPVSAMDDYPAPPKPVPSQEDQASPPKPRARQDDLTPPKPRIRALEEITIPKPETTRLCRRVVRPQIEREGSGQVPGCRLLHGPETYRLSDGQSPTANDGAVDARGVLVQTYHRLHDLRSGTR